MRDRASINRHSVCDRSKWRRFHSPGVFRLTKPIRAKISALGTYVPPRLLTNADLERMVDTNNEWIMARVGIRERHIVDKGVATSDLATEAARKALALRGMNPSEIEAIIVGTVTPD